METSPSNGTSEAYHQRYLFKAYVLFLFEKRQEFGGGEGGLIRCVLPDNLFDFPL